MSTLKPDEYQCAICRGVFSKGWSDEEALIELKVTFNKPVEECDAVCDDCYKTLILPQMKRDGTVH